MPEENNKTANGFDKSAEMARSDRALMALSVVYECIRVELHDLSLRANIETTKLDIVLYDAMEKHMEGIRKRLIARGIPVGPRNQEFHCYRDIIGQTGKPPTNIIALFNGADIEFSQTAFIAANPTLLPACIATFAAPYCGCIELQHTEAALQLELSEDRKVEWVDKGLSRALVHRWSETYFEYSEPFIHDLAELCECYPGSMGTFTPQNLYRYLAWCQIGIEAIVQMATKSEAELAALIKSIMELLSINVTLAEAFKLS